MNIYLQSLVVYFLGVVIGFSIGWSRSKAHTWKLAKPRIETMEKELQNVLQGHHSMATEYEIMEEIIGGCDKCKRQLEALQL